MVVLAALGAASSMAQAVGAAGEGYPELVTLSAQFREFVVPDVLDGVPDYRPAAMERQHRQLREFQARLAAITADHWPVSQQIDRRVLGAEMSALDFYHRVLRPWARDPSFYLQSQSGQRPSRGAALSVPANWPLSGAVLVRFETRLRAVPAIYEQAERNLISASGDLVTLALRHIGEEEAIFLDLMTLLDEHHDDLVDAAEAAVAAVQEYGRWLAASRSGMVAPAGIGKDNYSWWFRNVHLAPYGWDELMTIAENEYARAVAALKLEEHRNRDLPPLLPATSVDQYNQRWGEAEAYITRFLRDAEIITLPEYFGPIGPGLWWNSPDNPGGVADFFEQHRDRNPLPELAHNMLGHNLDELRRRHDDRPLRGQARLFEIDMVRSEGQAFALEELLMNVGLLDAFPRVRELVHIATAFRSVRAMADLKMHANELTLPEANRFCYEQTPYSWMVEGGHEVWFEMETTLRTPGWHTGMVLGKQQINGLIQERGHELGDDFVLRDFMDAFWSSGMIPISLIRWEMTGRNDEIANREG